MRVAEHRLDLGAAQRLDAAGRIHVLDRERRAEPALLARIGERARDRMQHAELHRSALRAKERRRIDQAGGRRGGARRRRLQQTAARTNAFISNNGWTYAGNEYDIAAASYDAAVRDSLPFTNGSSPALYVFAAGNSQPLVQHDCANFGFGALA